MPILPILSKLLQKVPNDLQVQTDSHCPILAKTKVVSSSKKASSSKSNPTAPLAKSSKTTSIKQVPSVSRNPQPARLAASKRKLISEGYSEEVVQRMVAPQSDATNDDNDRKWRKFCDWCEENGVEDPHYPTGPQVTEFFQYIIQVRDVEYQTAAAYRSMLSQSLKHHTSLNIGSYEKLLVFSGLSRGKNP